MRSLRPCLILAACASVAACGGEPSPDVAEQGGVPVECAPAGAQEFVATCYLVAAPSPEADWVIRHKDGTFHRLMRGDNPAGLAARDGAHPAEATVSDGFIYLTIDHDRYRWQEPAND